jgi:putative acyl-CoA dehydrogenase
MEPRTSLPGHEVTNQPPARGDRDLWAGDPVLRTHARGADDRGPSAPLGTVQAARWAREANTHLPELRAFDRGRAAARRGGVHPPITG